MKNKIDLEKIINEIDDYELDTFVAFYNDETVDIGNDLESIKEALNDSSKIFLQLGNFEYDEEFLGEPCFIFDGEDTVDDLEDDEYYNKYKSEEAGYGIYLDKDLNVEYGYFTSGTFYDFKDARDDDEVKSEIYSLLDEVDIWKTDDNHIAIGKYDKEVSLLKLFNLKTDILCFVNDKCFDVKQEDDILSELNKEKPILGLMPIVGISNIVLDNGGKLYFKLTNDEGIFVIRKNRYKDVSQVGKYSPEEGEILFDKECYKDIYLNPKEFKPKFTNIDEVNALLKDKKINLDATIDCAGSTDIFDYEPLVEVMDNSIYIRTVYASEGEGSGEEIYEYGIEDDDFVSVEVYSGLGNYDLRVSPQCYTGDESGDYGILIGEDGEISFCENTGGMFGGISEIRDLSEPLNAFVIEILMNIIVFAFPSDEVLMYCPDCGEDYNNGEELCPDCGTKLVTEFEIAMLEYQGLL